MGSLSDDIEDNFIRLKQEAGFTELQGEPEKWSDIMCYSLITALRKHMQSDQMDRALRRLLDARLELREAARNHDEWLQVFQRLVAGPSAAVGNAMLHQVQEGQLELEFAAEYQDPQQKVISYLIESIDRFYRKWSTSLDGPKFYAPCTAIVQSSGWGKSRAMREVAMAPNQIVVFYFTLLDENATGYPKADPEVLYYFKSITKLEHGYRVFHACFEMLSEKESFPSKQELFQDHEQKRYHRFREKLRGRRECTADEMRAECLKVQKQHAAALRSNGVTFLFVIDEARTLLKSKDWVGEFPFVLLRRACSHLAKSSQSFVLFIDTTSWVSNFTPQAGLDPSAKVNKGQEQLFPPLPRLPTFDLMVDAAPPLVDANAPPLLTSVKGFPSPEVWLRQGRPLWAAKKFPENWLGQILSFALLKLCGGLMETSPGFSHMLEKPYMSLVMLGRRIGVDISPQSPSAQELVASHMSVCLHVSASREYVLCTSLPEPALNEAAAQYLRGHRDTLCKQLRQLNSLLLKGIASAGERGELVARILLIDVMDKLQKDVITKPVGLKKLLEALLPSHDLTEFPDDLKEAKVFFNAFHRFFGKPSVTDARKFIKKGVAMICAAMQQAFDLYIFFVKPDEDGQYDVENDECIGCMAVQAKNWKVVSGIRSTLLDMKEYASRVPAHEISPDLMLLLHVGADATKKEMIQNIMTRQATRKGKATLKGKQEKSEWGGLIMDSGSKPVLVAKGLHTIVVKDDISEIVTLLLTQSPDPVTIMCEDVRGLIGADNDQGTDAEVDREKNALVSILAAVYPDNKADMEAGSSGKAGKRRKLS